MKVELFKDRKESKSEQPRQRLTCNATIDSSHESRGSSSLYRIQNPVVLNDYRLREDFSLILPEFQIHELGEIGPESFLIRPTG